MTIVFIDVSKKEWLSNGAIFADLDSAKEAAQKIIATNSNLSEEEFQTKVEHMIDALECIEIESATPNEIREIIHQAGKIGWPNRGIERAITQKEAMIMLNKKSEN
jgi:hypothetical protein